jgi:hypothetical protein
VSIGFPSRRPPTQRFKKRGLISGPILLPDLPTFRQWFPEFGTELVTDSVVTQALLAASLWIDPAMWSVTDYPMAVLYWSAHWIQMIQNQIATMEIAGTGATDVFLRTINIGERTLGFAERSGDSSAEAMAAPGESLFDETIYGMLYLQLRARNIIGVLVV